MKKFFVLATAALMITGVSFAEGGKGKKKKCGKSKTCCKATKECCKDNAEKTAKL